MLTRRIWVLLCFFPVLVLADDRLSNRAPAHPQSTSSKSDSADSTMKWLPRHGGSWNHSLRTARSDDGLRFRPDHGSFIKRANAPTLLSLGNGELLLAFESFDQKSRRDFGRLGYATSTDDGKTWTAVRPLLIRGLRRSMGWPRGPVLLKGTDNQVELYFWGRTRKGRQQLFVAKQRDRQIKNAKSDQEKHPKIEFAIRGRLSLKEKDVKLEDICMANINGCRHIYGTNQSKPKMAYHGILADSHTIRGQGPLNRDQIGTAGSVLFDGGIYRLYASLASGVVSSISGDGSDWVREPGLCLAQATDPSVIRLRGGTYLMVYVEQSNSPHGDDRLSTEGDSTPSDEKETDDEWYTSLSEDEAGEATDPATDGLLDEALESDRPMDGDELEPDQSEEAIAKANVNEADHLNEFSGQTEEAIEAEEDYEQLYCQGDVPVPDFKHYVDYRAWIESRHNPDGVAENAVDYYAAFMPMPGDATGDKPQWPQFNSLFFMAGSPNTPQPWNPAEHPDWESTFHASAELEQKYAQAAAIEDYVPRLLWPQPGPPDQAHDKDSENLLLNFLLPSLRSHRAMTKQILGDAWRAPGGRLDPERMLDAFDTTLGGAEHLAHGDFLIQSLVSVAQKRLIEKNARWALKQNAFSADEMESALEIFIEKDRRLPDPGEMLRGELAASLDYSQYVFGPIVPDREPALNPARAAYISDMVSDPPPTEQEVVVADPHQTAETLVDYYDHVADMMRRGYPEVRPEDIRQIEQTSVQDNYAVRSILPSLSRYYQLINRSEASRRATQLSYAIHLYKARNGQWPASLDALPSRYTDTVRIDPFSQKDFVYRVTENGPLLYSTSENGVDDGGSHHRRWGDRKQDEDEGDDYVFWPPR